MKRSNGEKPIIQLENITLRVGGSFILPDTSWEIRKGQQWAVLGPNGAGKSSLVGALVGKVPIVRGRVNYPCQEIPRDRIGYVSLELQQRLIAQEEERDEARFFSGKIDTFVKVRQIIFPDNEIRTGITPPFDRVMHRLGVDSLLDRGIRFLSTGEMQKVLIARALMKFPQLLILDEPFEGVDESSRKRVADIIEGLMKDEIQVILVTHRFEAIVPGISHVICLRNGKLFLKGPREEVLTPENMDRLYDRQKAKSFIPVPVQEDLDDTAWGESGSILEMKNTTVRYGDVLVLDNLNWSVKRGESWVVLGPNGSGKSTLLSLITGDNPQAYANEIYLFGRRRGTGESIWEIKRRIGMVSSKLQIQYRKRLKVMEVILSGFHDSIGLYRKTSRGQQAIARQWMEILGIEEMAHESFEELSYGQRRMVLLARCMVKQPILLALDEPCQGLDQSNRKMIVDLIDKIGRETATHILYTTHHPHEIPSSITRVLRLEKAPPV